VSPDSIHCEHEQCKKNPDPQFRDLKDILEARGESFKHRR
jgi:hypothetical protein